MQSNKIILAGFSGAGKSSFLEALRQTAPPHWQFSDLDSEIVTRSGSLSLKDYIEQNGWEKFRHLEGETLRGWLESPGQSALALGGGSLTESSLKFIKSRPGAVLFYIHADFETCWKRIEKTGSERPLVQKGKEIMRELYEERSKIFQKIPQVIENHGDKSLRELALELWSRLEG